MMFYIQALIADTIGAFNMGFDAANLHRLTLSLALAAAALAWNRSRSVMLAERGGGVSPAGGRPTAIYSSLSPSSYNAMTQGLAGVALATSSHTIILKILRYALLADETVGMGLADTARRVIACRSTQETRVRDA